MFRPSRPDFIETLAQPVKQASEAICSGLLGRTSLRLTTPLLGGIPNGLCSGLLGRTSLRPRPTSRSRRKTGVCSGLLGRTSLRPEPVRLHQNLQLKLFRPSRPDFIETGRHGEGGRRPANCSGLLGRTSLRRVAGRVLTAFLDQIVPAF